MGAGDIFRHAGSYEVQDGAVPVLPSARLLQVRRQVSGARGRGGGGGGCRFVFRFSFVRFVYVSCLPVLPRSRAASLRVLIV